MTLPQRGQSALDRGDDLTVELDRVVAGRKRRCTGRDVLVAELPRVPLVDVDDNIESQHHGFKSRPPHTDGVWRLGREP